MLEIFGNVHEKPCQEFNNFGINIVICNKSLALFKIQEKYLKILLLGIHQNKVGCHILNLNKDKINYKIEEKYF